MNYFGTAEDARRLLRAVVNTEMKIIHYA